MRKTGLGSLFFIFIQTISATASGSIPANYNWSGFYLGATTGDTLGHFKTNTSTTPGSYLDATQVAAINNAGKQKIITNSFITGLEGGYNWQSNHLLLGLETDVQAISLNGSTYTNAIPFPNDPSHQFVLTSYANDNWLFTLRPRIGVVTGNWLVYATGGLGLTLLQNDFLYSTNRESSESRRISQWTPGYMVGGGIETGLTRNISLKMEYLFGQFNNNNAYAMNHNLPAPQIFSNSSKLQSNTLRFGLNYHFNDCAMKDILPLSSFQNLFNTQVGVRAWASSGNIGAPNPLLDGNGAALISRLIYKNLMAYSGETFGRIDHISGLFAKGILGAGSINDGKLNDEDFPAGGAYSNTLSNASGNLSYGTIDAGYTFLNSLLGKTSAFVGYNYYSQNVGVYNCKQIAGSTVCSHGELGNFLGISEEDKFKSLRLGLLSEFELTPRLSLSAETAYLPLVDFSGRDYHNARQLILPEQSAKGNGVMLESILNYKVTPSWSVGLGGRFWTWNMPKGSVNFKFLSGDEGNATQAAHFNSQRYGVFLQASYKEGNLLNVCQTSGPMNWKGLFVGGHLGGAWNNSHWSDPFGPTPGDAGLINVAGFGDQINTSGPFGGGNINFNLQKNWFVYGLGASMSGADMRGENTLFSGLGGINGKAIINYLSTMVIRLGAACDRSLFYINGGSALTNTTYELIGYTGVLTLGSQSKMVNSWGWTLGTGVEYALTNHWTTGFEYNYIGIPQKRVSFANIDLLNTKRLYVSQQMNLFKLSLNYKIS